MLEGRSSDLNVEFEIAYAAAIRASQQSPFAGQHSKRSKQRASVTQEEDISSDSDGMNRDSDSCDIPSLASSDSTPRGDEDDLDGDEDACVIQSSTG